MDLTMRTENNLEIWTIYDHPLDYPNGFVARKFLLDQPTDEAVYAPTLDEAQKVIKQLSPIQLTRIERLPQDHPNIVEAWL
jgi:hypothetical protein